MWDDCEQSLHCSIEVLYSKRITSEVSGHTKQGVHAWQVAKMRFVWLQRKGCHEVVTQNGANCLMHVRIRTS